MVFKKIPNQLLPQNIQKKLEFWKHQQKEMVFVNCTTDSLPVVLCFVVSDNFPYILAGGSCQDSFEKAINKSFSEVEYASITWEKFENVGEQSVETIKKPDQHGTFYAQSKNSIKIIKKLDSLGYTNELKETITFDETIKKFDPLIVEIKKPEDENDIWVIRVLSEKLILLGFGYGLDPVNNKRYKLLKTQVIYDINSPHFFP
jgi:hypothetical protein